MTVNEEKCCNQKPFSILLQFVSHPFLFKRVKLRWQRGSPFRLAGVLHILGWLLFIALETILTPLLLPLIGYTFYRDQDKNRNQMKSHPKPEETIPEGAGEKKEQLELVQQDKDQMTKNPEETPEDGGGAKEKLGWSSEGIDRSRDIFGMRTSTYPH